MLGRSAPWWRVCVAHQRTLGQRQLLDCARRPAEHHRAPINQRRPGDMARLDYERRTQPRYGQCGMHRGVDVSARHGVTQIGMTDEAMFNWATSTMSGEGIAKASWGRIDPPLHVLAGDRLWCTEAWT